MKEGKEVHGKNKDKKDKKNDQIKRINKLEIAVPVILEIPHNGARNPGVYDVIKEDLIKNPDPLPLGAPSVCVKLLTDSLLSALIYDQQQIKENFNQRKIVWEVRKKLYGYEKT